MLQLCEWSDGNIFAYISSSIFDTLGILLFVKAESDLFIADISRQCTLRSLTLQIEEPNLIQQGDSPWSIKTSQRSNVRWRTIANLNSE